MIFGQPTEAGAVPYTSSGEMRARFFLIRPGISRNAFGVTPESIRRNAGSFVGKPLVHYEECSMGSCVAVHPKHPEGATCARVLEIQEPHRVGTIIDVEISEGATATAVVRIENDALKEKLRGGEQMFVSPSICGPPDGSTPEGTDEWGRVVHMIHEWTGSHLALVGMPAYGPEATVLSVCEGAACDEKTQGGLPEFAAINLTQSIHKSNSPDPEPIRGPDRVGPGEISMLGPIHGIKVDRAA